MSDKENKFSFENGASKGTLTVEQSGNVLVLTVEDGYQLVQSKSQDFPNKWWFHVARPTRIELPDGAISDNPKCRCGSGAHPRRCNVHPWGFRLHVAKLNAFLALADAYESERDFTREEAEDFADDLIDELISAVTEKIRTTG